MQSTTKLLALALGGAIAACGSSNATPASLGLDGDSGAASNADGGNNSSSSGGSSSGGSSSGGSSSGGSSSGSSSGGSSSGGGSDAGGSSGGGDAGAAGFAIPLASPGGADFEYTAQVTVGGQVFAMQIDTGSTTAALGGTGCTTCTGVSPLYAPSSSAKATGKNGSSTYVDGSGWSGPIYTDTVSLENGSPSVTIDVVDMTKSTGQFFSGQNDYQGILGLGPAGNAIDNSTGGYMPSILAAIPNVFAFKFCDSTGDNAGTMWLGGDGNPGSAVVYTPLLPIAGQNQYYAINVNALSLGTTSIASNAASTFAKPVLDTGTSLFYVPTTVFNTFQTTLAANAAFKTLFGTATFTTDNQGDVCVTSTTSVTDAQIESSLPTITLSLPAMTSGQPDVTISASALDTYLYAGTANQYCLAIQDGGAQDPSTFGDAFMQAFHTVVDITGGRVGFAPTSCAAPAFHRAKHPANKQPHRGPRPDWR